jgi:hypothetical protein
VYWCAKKKRGWEGGTALAAGCQGYFRFQEQVPGEFLLAPCFQATT